VSTKPKYPLLIVDPKGWIGINADEQKQRFSLFGALNTKRWTGYDSAGCQWHVVSDSFPYPDTWWTRMLANTVYNPRFEVELRWRTAGSYLFEDLQTSICALIDKDDDLLTQFISADRLKRVVKGCKTLDELVAMLKSMKVLST
jgi:hypothetical protein